jgi:hypothetical protein
LMSRSRRDEVVRPSHQLIFAANNGSSKGPSAELCPSASSGVPLK